ncbi:sulfatase-like hydrolase/transferase [bacterium]|nr:sulfatase-like hydrolase/transferase [bacterium]
MTLLFQIKTVNGIIKEKYKLPIAESSKGQWVDIRVPVADLSGSAKCTMKMIIEDTETNRNNICLLVASPMFIPKQIEKKPNIILWTFDSLRSDELGAYGSPDANTPTLDGSARRGVLFTESLSSSCWTLPGVKNMMAGLITHQYLGECRPFHESVGLELPLIQSEFAKAG